jgi:hypothetical protein
MDPAAFRDYQKRWCDRLSEIPHVEEVGVHPLTPAQQAVADNQRAPENQWVLHPEIDGCQPDDRHESPVR